MGIETLEEKQTTRKPRRVAPAPAGRGLSMDKWLCWGSLGIAALLLLLFLLDLFAGFPFNGANKVLDVCAIIAAGIIIYISWDTVREIK